MVKITGAGGVIMCTLAMTALLAFYVWPPMQPVPDIRFTNHTEAAGLLRHSPTFSLVVTDLDNDGNDDLVVGNHGYPPAFFLNRDAKFIEQIDLNPLKQRDDRHVYTFADLDNDGDRDFVYAGGGAEGLAKGSPNRAFQNHLMESGTLEFREVSQQSDIAFPNWRSRAFYPLPSADGKYLDLFLTAIHLRRKGSTNLYTVNSSHPGHVELRVDKSSPRNIEVNSDGKDLMFDYDRDGLMDFLSVATTNATLFRNEGGTFTRVKTALDALQNVKSVVAADFNNDGYQDLYFGGTSGYSHSDNVSSNDKEIHFSVERQDGDLEDMLSFTTTSLSLDFDFFHHVKGGGTTGVNASDVFIGRERLSPPKRKGALNRKQATGVPKDMTQAGTYIWYAPDTQLWHVLWRHRKAQEKTSKGIIYGKDIDVKSTSGFEHITNAQVQDYIMINEQGRSWKRLPLDLLKHNYWTNYLTAADFNNDGFIDIAGVRAQDPAKPNGNPFVLINRGRLQFAMRDIMSNAADDIFRADAIVHGFFNNDGLPDLFYSNGFGLLPGHVGPYQMWLNSTSETGGYVLLSLKGTRANKDAIGAQIELYNEDDDLLGYREIGPGFGRGQDTLQVHFGLGDYAGPLRAKILWPAGQVAQNYALAGGGKHFIVEE